MKVTLLTAASKEYWPLIALTSPNKLEYCIRHGVQLNVLQHTKDASCAGLERVEFMRDALKSYDTNWLWFMGADTLITNMTIDVRDHCDDAFDLIMGVDINGINNDSFLLRSSPESLAFLERVNDRQGAPHDQAAMAREMHREGMRTKLVSQRLFNSFKYDEYKYGEYEKGNWQDGDFVLHLPGMNNQRRFALLLEYSQKIRR